MESMWAVLPDRRYQTLPATNPIATTHAARKTPSLARLSVLSADAGMAVILADSASRFSRCKSVRISDACHGAHPARQHGLPPSYSRRKLSRYSRTSRHLLFDQG